MSWELFKIEEMIFKTNNLVFNDFIHFSNIKIPKNKVTFIVGKSGAGKTTLLKMFNGTLTQSSGDIFYNNTNILDIETIKLRKEVLLISQAVFLFDGTIKDNFNEFYSYRQEKTPDDDTIKLFLDICQLDFSLDKDCSEMSGGEKQRLYIAIYLSFKPKVIMFDEPTSALDEENANEILKNILSFSRKNGITVIVVSHDKKLSKVFADSTVAIE